MGAVDAVIQVVLDQDVRGLRNLIHYTRAPCTYREGMGGPPKCRAGEKEGTVVEVLPFLGSEGHHLRRDEVEVWPGLSVSGVHAAYRNSAQVYSDEYYPAGEYAVVFAGRQPKTVVTVQVGGDGIVRIDYGIELPDEETLRKIAAQVMVAPGAP